MPPDDELPVYPGYGKQRKAQPREAPPLFCQRQAG
ncbi:hypothetical protein PC110_g19116 [Phytophthora cactorum]|uniref:Uncharacterized protein n=1 Tax=Phytophthora cactorum TaxID=29920 RepID=A0A329RJD2_9STRA|nr:hypothetical protein PC110_g19116 [Phytophthora cactorum]